MNDNVTLFDSTLRDGAQAEGISFSVSDKLKIVRLLDNLQITYIEAGNPGSNPKDMEFFKMLKNEDVKNSRLVAFGSTCRKNVSPQRDVNVQKLLEAGTEGVSIVGKSWDFHVEKVLGTTLEENLRMIRDTIRYLKDEGKEVIFDAEHFYDGYKENPDYSIETVKAAEQSGADWIVLCDTNGGTMTKTIEEVTLLVSKKLKAKIGIHCHNDSGLAVANSLASVTAGVRQIQGTFIGYGERCGNTNLCTVIPSLQLKMGYKVLPDEKILELTTAARYMAELSNIQLDEKSPYVGRSAFAHKGGMHTNGISKDPRTFEHISPESVGNERRVLMSEVSGRSSIMKTINKVSGDIDRNSQTARNMIKTLKELEYEGYQFEGAESSFELIVRKQLGVYEPFFILEDFKIINGKVEQKSGFGAYAMVKVIVGNVEEVTAAEGDGPVNALDIALRKALEVFYPKLKELHLTDYKVRVLDTQTATAAKVRVLIESTDGKNIWNTVGVSTNIIEASLIALADSIEMKLLHDKQ